MISKHLGTFTHSYIYIYICQHLKWIKKVYQSCPKIRTHFGFRTTSMKVFDSLQMLTTVYKLSFKSLGSVQLVSLMHLFDKNTVIL